MTDKEYLNKSAGAQKRLTQVREQIGSHVGTADRRAANPIIRPLLDRQQEIIDELTALDDEFWSA